MKLFHADLARQKTTLVEIRALSFELEIVAVWWATTYKVCITNKTKFIYKNTDPNEIGPSHPTHSYHVLFYFIPSHAQKRAKTCNADVWVFQPLVYQKVREKVSVWCASTDQFNEMRRSIYFLWFCFCLLYFFALFSIRVINDLLWIFVVIINGFWPDYKYLQIQLRDKLRYYCVCVC